MQARTTKNILIVFGIQAVFLAGILSLHIAFSLPHAQLEGVDCVTLPAEEVALRCIVEVAPPGPRAVRSEGVSVAFFAARPRAGAAAERVALGSVKAGAGGLATLPWKAPADIGTVTEVVPEIQDQGEVIYQPIRPRPYILIQTLSEGALLIVCDIEALLETPATWDGLDRSSPADWPLDIEAATALDALTQERTRQIVYVAPGTKLLTAEVRAALLARHFPRGPVLFPDAPPGPGSPAQTIAEVLRKWPYTKCGIFRRPAVAQALSAKNVPAVAVGRVPAGVLALPKVRTVLAWRELPALVGSL